MLNISDHKVPEHIVPADCEAFCEVYEPRMARNVSRWLTGILSVMVLALFLPWTQNIQGKGKLTTLQPDQRPQTIHSTIAGRIETWYVNEGDTVRKGDTIVFLSEIKDDYFDPLLVDRTGEQIVSKQGAIRSYGLKADALSDQMTALRAAQELKIRQAEAKLAQAKNKVNIDSTELIAQQIAMQIAETQFRRWDTLYTAGIKSRTEWEDKRNKQQEAMAKYIGQVNKLELSRNELLNARLELSNVRNEYAEKIAKSESDRQSALSDQFDTEAQVAKMENQRTNYERRVQFRYITAPQDGLVNKALKPGIGETVKEGEAIVSILPLHYQIAAEIFVRPVDLPLLYKGAPVRLEFDGWPAIVFSGWPGASFGTFGGKVYAIEANLSENGSYRVLVEPDPLDEPWPAALRIGSGANGFALLSNVSLWYELWRQLNGFPPDFYTPSTDTASKEGGKK